MFEKNFKTEYKYLKAIGLFIGIILLIICIKILRFNANHELQEIHNSFHSVGIGVIGWIIVSLLFSCVLDLLRKSKEEKLIKIGFKEEVESIVHLYQSGTFSEKEVENKFNHMLDKSQVRKEKEILTKISENESKEREEQVLALENLKAKNIISETEYNLKISQLLKEGKSDIDISEIEKMISRYKFDNIEDLLSKTFNPSMRIRNTGELLEIINDENWDIAAIYQAYIELKKRSS